MNTTHQFTTTAILIHVYCLAFIGDNIVDALETEGGKKFTLISATQSGPNEIEVYCLMKSRMTFTPRYSEIILFHWPSVHQRAMTELYLPNG